ncbi:MFS transporter [Granulicatella elegans]|uniref:MFS transporter n=1 Tax=Granulicatella elegans TaxID=137732 RepID=UPI001D136C01|nr:MFS transporter [Granulicatella elegans]UEA30667.1 MFS transporter [Granulicatella elegans]
MKLSTISKFSLVSISTLLMSHLAISPVLPKLYDYYHGMNPELGLASVESLATIPAMMITIFVLMSNLVMNKIGKKNTVLLGISLIIIFGPLPVFLTNFKLVMMSRMLLGAGIGLFNSLSISLMSDFFESDEKATMIGMRTAFLNIGKALTTFLSGYLLLFGERAVFLTYLIAIPIFLLFYHSVPNTPVEQRVKKKGNIRLATVVLTLLTFLVGVSYMGLTIKIPSLILTYYQLEVALSRNLLTILALSGTIAGIIFGLLLKKVGDLTLPMMLLSMAVGSLIFIFFKHIVLYYVASVLIGVSFVGTMSYIFYFISRIFDKEEIHLTTSIVLVGGNIGVILTPVIMTKFPEWMNWNPFIAPFYMTSAFMGIVAMISGWYVLKK